MGKALLVTKPTVFGIEEFEWTLERRSTKKGPWQALLEKGVRKKDCVPKIEETENNFNDRYLRAKNNQSAAKALKTGECEGKKTKSWGVFLSEVIKTNTVLGRSQLIGRRRREGSCPRERSFRTAGTS